MTSWTLGQSQGLEEFYGGVSVEIPVTCHSGAAVGTRQAGAPAAGPSEGAGRIWELGQVWRGLSVAKGVCVHVGRW